MYARMMGIALVVGLAACTVEQVREGEAPEIEVEPGQAPAYDVDPAQVEIGEDTQVVRTPTIDIVPADSPGVRR